MEKVIVAVGSARASKIDAVRQALDVFGGILAPGEKFDVVGMDVPSGVGHTPRSRKELMAGARGRAASLMNFARERREPWSYFVGLEGGVDVVVEGARRWAFLECWAFVSDVSGREAYGHAGGILLPEALAREVLDRGTELASAIDAFAGGRGIRDAQGSWGVLTRDIIARPDALCAAVINAFAPFFNAPLYR